MPAQHSEMPPTRRPHQVTSIVYGALLLVALLHLLSSLPFFYQLIASYQQASTVYRLNAISDELYKAVNNLGFERGRTNVVLQDAGPVTQTEVNRQFIADRRRDGEQALKQAIDGLTAEGFNKAAGQVAAVQQHQFAIKQLRSQTDAAMLLPKAERSPQLASHWFGAMTSYIEAIEALLQTISNDISDADGLIARYSSLKQATLALRNSAGPEISLLAGTINAKTPLSPEQVKKIERLQIVNQQRFKELEHLSNPLASAVIPQALAELQRVYRSEYLPYRAATLPAARIGGPYPFNHADFLRQGVKALDQISAFNTVVMQATQQYADAQRARVKRQITAQIASSLGSFLVIVLIFWYFHARIITPLSQLTLAIRRLAAKDLTIEIPSIREDNEIGELATAVHVFRNMALQIDNDMQTMQQLQVKLQESHDLLTNLSRQIPGIIYQFQLFTDGRSCCPYMSEAIRTLAGLDPDDLKTTADPFFRLIHPDDTAAVHASINQSATTLQTWEVQFRLLLPRQGYRWLYGFARPERLADGSTLWHGFINDITAQRELSEELMAARTAADTANRSKSEFLAAMSHEIRTPMNGVIGMSQLLELTELTPEQQEYTDLIKSSAHDLLAIINDILDLSKIEAGKVELEQREFSLQRCIEQTVLMQKSAAFEKGLQITFKPAEDLPALVRGDQLRIKQILLNLLSNAIKFTEQGSIAINAVLQKKQDHHALIRITVSDSGIGMTTETLAKLFTPFTQADISTSRRFGGTGLGLSICRQLAELMGGRIWAESEPGLGSRFHLELPLEVLSDAIACTTTAPAAAVTAPLGQPLHILLAEDHHLNQQTTSLLLQKMGHRVSCADDGQQAVQRWQQGGLDLILMDVHMPIMSGSEALHVIRKQEAATGAQPIPIIALTADAVKGARERLLADGFDGYLAKPFSLLELQAAISLPD
ncbi:ATP-binding protein [Trichlorobacter sp.]|uniref:ATP-binding protein n=1 Tax=Trichlorobacter sp. TaxID=2911007 RepID=UPI002A35A632|nr:ATP-binding protein [Trichlorobacter sp.]MDY0383764.1 ATP-binding protein [Trichlorobacter sp.]